MAHSTDDIAGPLGVVGDVGQGVPDLVGIRFLRGEEAYRRLGVGYDGIEGLVQLVGHGGCQLAHGGDPGHVGDLVKLQLLLHL